MFKKNELEAQMKRAGVTHAEVAAALHISSVTLWRKMKDNGRFTREEICILIKFLGIDDPKPIFFAD